MSSHRTLCNSLILVLVGLEPQVPVLALILATKYLLPIGYSYAVCKCINLTLLSGSLCLKLRVFDSYSRYSMFACFVVYPEKLSFLPRDAMLSDGVCPSVRQSVCLYLCLSHSYIVSRRLKMS